MAAALANLQTMKALKKLEAKEKQRKYLAAKTVNKETRLDACRDVAVYVFKFVGLHDRLEQVQTRQ